MAQGPFQLDSGIKISLPGKSDKSDRSDKSDKSDRSDKSGSKIKIKQN